MEKRACRDAGPKKRGDVDLFFPEKGQSALINEAILNFCFKCPVRRECKQYQKDTGADSGVWGGEYIGRGD